MHVFPCMFFFCTLQAYFDLSMYTSAKIIQMNEWGCSDRWDGLCEKNRGNFSSIVCERRRERGREGGREGGGEREPGRGREIYQERKGGGGRIRISLMEREVEK